MADFAEHITMDQALAIMEDSPAPAPSRTESLPDTFDPGDLEDYGGHEFVQYQGEEAGGLPEFKTIDQAVASLADDEPPAIQSEEMRTRPVAVVEDEEVTLPQLVQGYAASKQLRDHAITLYWQGEAVQQFAESVATSAWDIASLLADLMPQPPNPALAQYDTHAYLQQQTLYEMAMERVQMTLNDASYIRQQAVAHLEHDNNESILLSENEKLAHHFPETADEEGRQEFFDSLREIAYACDFTEEDMQSVKDHRIFRLAHLALVGLRAKTHRKQKSRRRKESKRSNAETMQRLRESGSLRDAVEVDFE